MIKITCSECNHVFQIDESRVPSGSFKVKCPACTKVIVASKAQTSSESETSAAASVSPVTAGLATPATGEWERIRPQVEALVKNAVDTAKREILVSIAAMIGSSPAPHSAPVLPSASSEDTGRRALVCDSDASSGQTISQILHRQGYRVQVCTMASDALNRLESNFFDLVTTEITFQDDREGGQKILGKINGRKPDERRKVFVAVVSETIKTSPPHGAFFQGANICLNKGEMKNLDGMLQEGLKHFRDIYANYYELLREAGEKL